MNKFIVFLLLLSVVAFGADPRIEQGARFEAQGEFEKALAEYRAILAENPKSSEAYFAAAQARVKMKDYSGAIANYRLAYKFNPTMSEAYEGVAKVYETLGEKSKAAAERAKDPKNNPVVENAIEKSDSVVVNSQTNDKNNQVKTDTLKITKVEAKSKIDSAKSNANKTEPANDLAKKVEPEKVAKVENEKANALVKDDIFEKGKALFEAKKFSEAAPLWRDVLRKQPGHSGAYFYAGLTRYELGEFDKAEFNLKKGLDYKERGNDANYFLALIYHKSGKTDLETKFLAAYIKNAQPNGKYRAAAELLLHDIKNAKKAAKDSIAKKIDKAPVNKVLVKSDEQNLKQPVNKDSVKVKSEKTISIDNANILFAAKDFESALQMYKSLLETLQDPEEKYFVMLQIGNSYRELRDFHSAITRYREVVLQYPDSDWASEAERALEDAVWLESHAQELPKKMR